MSVRLAISDQQWVCITPRLAAATRRGPKLHAAVSERGELLQDVATAGQVNDVTQACMLIDGTKGEVVVGDGWRR